MKTLLLTLTLIISIPVLFTGCATSGQPVTVKDFTPAIKTAAMIGTAVSLNEHPEWRPAFNEALADLQIIEGSATIDFNTLFEIVNRLPVKQLKSSNAQLAIAGGTILLSEYASRIDLSQAEKIRPVVSALRAGIELGLN